MIFHGDEYYHAFLETIGEVKQRFQCVIHAYCLMGNHYHLSVETPNANLGRIMRHINGVYTQRDNRLKKTDGPLFRGRYKAILIDHDAYLLQLSRYIHRNPVEMKHVKLPCICVRNYLRRNLQRSPIILIYTTEVLSVLSLIRFVK